MLTKLGRVLRNEEGIETLEWIAMAALIIIGVAVVAYPTGLLTAVQGVIDRVSTALAGAGA